MKKIISIPLSIFLLLIGQVLYSQGYNFIQLDSLVNKAMTIGQGAGVAVVMV